MNTFPNVAMINRHAFSSNSSFSGDLLRTIRFWRERASQRRALACLDDRALHDIGLSRSSALGEAEKPFWRD